MRTSMALLTVVVALALLVVGLSGVSDADEDGRMTGHGYANATTPSSTRMVESTPRPELAVLRSSGDLVLRDESTR